MLNQLFKIITPEIIGQAIKDNPKVFIETLQRFDTFRLIGNALTQAQQLIVSNNTKLLNPFISSENGKEALKLFTEEFCTYVSTIKAAEDKALKEKEEAIKKDEEEKRIAAELIKQQEIDRLNLATKEAEIMRAKLNIEARVRKEIEYRIRKEIEDSMRAPAVAEVVTDVLPK